MFPETLRQVEEMQQRAEILFSLGVIAALATLVARSVPDPPFKPVADFYVARKYIGPVLKIDKTHLFGDGTISEGWLVRRNDLEMWWSKDRVEHAQIVIRPH